MSQDGVAPKACVWIVELLCNIDVLENPMESNVLSWMIHKVFLSNPYILHGTIPISLTAQHRFFWNESSVVPILHKHPQIPCTGCNPATPFSITISQCLEQPILHQFGTDLSHSSSCTNIWYILSCAALLIFKRDKHRHLISHVKKRHVYFWGERWNLHRPLKIYINVFNTDWCHFTSISESILWPTSIAQVVRMVRSLGQKLEDRQLVLLSRPSDTLLLQIFCVFFVSFLMLL